MENNDISSMLASVLGNKDIMEKLRGIAADTAPSGNDTGACAGCAPPAPPCDGGHEKNPTARDRRRLIEALEPYLSPERCEAANKLLLVTELIGSGNFPKDR